MWWEDEGGNCQKVLNEVDWASSGAGFPFLGFETRMAPKKTCKHKETIRPFHSTKTHAQTKTQLTWCCTPRVETHDFSLAAGRSHDQSNTVEKR